MSTNLGENELDPASLVGIFCMFQLLLTTALTLHTFEC